MQLLLKHLKVNKNKKKNPIYICKNKKIHLNMIYQENSLIFDRCLSHKFMLQRYTKRDKPKKLHATRELVLWLSFLYVHSFETSVIFHI